MMAMSPLIRFHLKARLASWLGAVLFMGVMTALPEATSAEGDLPQARWEQVFLNPSKVSEIAKSKPSIGLEIYFEFNSALISATEEPKLEILGTALIDPALAEGVFLIAGFGEPAGGERYNLALADHRARSIKRFLIDTFHLRESRLVTVAYIGPEHLVNSNDPFAPENRRVEITNLE